MARAAVWHTIVLFCHVMLRSPKPGCFMPTSWYLWKALIWVQVHWLETVWSYCVEEAIDYWTIFSTKTKKNSTLKTILEYGVKDFLFFIFYFLEWILLLEIQKNCKNWVWKEKSVWALNVFTLGSTAQATLVPHEIKKKKNP
jgi:hypothetical protein